MLVLVGMFGVLVEPTLDRFRSAGGPVLLPGVAEAVRRLNQAGHRVVALTECFGPSELPLDRTMLESIHGQLRGQLQQYGAQLDDILIGGPADARGGGAVGEAVRRYRTAPSETVLIADSLPPQHDAAALGCRRVLVRTGRGARTQAEGLPREVLPIQLHEDLPAAVKALLGGDE